MTDPLSQPSGTTNPSVAQPGHAKEDFKDKMNREEKFYGEHLQTMSSLVAITKAMQLHS
jgi:hypothetical protein